MFINFLYQKFFSATLYYRSQKQRSAHTKVKRKGILTKFLRLVAPVVHVIDKVGLRFLLDYVAIQAIQRYQKHLSPHKGFSCAYSRLHGAESCSEYFRKKVRTYGLSKAIPLFEQRLRDCKLANATLKAQRRSRRNSQINSDG
ncbi:membrane protein insertion efficiency factor YidD [Microcoleus sp. Pol11C3]|uniref:membrane protein insertion efficiency factor YidD n=1 Tax=Microcoleus sp. Pol11C3 TaxID=3055390 RepID=UPI00404089A6